MMFALIQSYSIGQIAIAIVIIAAIVAVVIVVVKQMGIAIPGWFLTILWILLAAVIGVFAVRFLMSI